VETLDDKISNKKTLEQEKFVSLIRLINDNIEQFEGLRVWENIPTIAGVKEFKTYIYRLLTDRVNLVVKLKEKAKEEEKKENYYIELFLKKGNKDKEALKQSHNIIVDILTSLAIEGIISSAQLAKYSKNFNQVSDNHDKVLEFNAMLKVMEKPKPDIIIPFGYNLKAQLGQVMTIGGEGGVGKTDFIIKMATSLAEKGYTIDYFNLEIKQEEFWGRIASMYGIGKRTVEEMPYGGKDFKNKITIKEMAFIGNKFLDKITPYHSVNGEDKETGYNHIYNIERVISETNSQIIFIDWIGEVEVPGRLPEHEHFAYVAKKAKALALKYNKFIVLLGALNKYDKKQKIHQDDLKGGYHLKHASHILVAMRFHEDGILLDVLKNRNGEKNKTLLVSYNKATKEFQKEVQEVEE
jgi:hypothetical protein